MQWMPKVSSWARGAPWSVPGLSKPCAVSTVYKIFQGTSFAVDSIFPGRHDRPVSLPGRVGGPTADGRPKTHSCGPSACTGPAAPHTGPHPRPRGPTGAACAGDGCSGAGGGRPRRRPDRRAPAAAGAGRCAGPAAAGTGQPARGPGGGSPCGTSSTSHAWRLASPERSVADAAAGGGAGAGPPARLAHKVGTAASC